MLYKFEKEKKYQLQKKLEKKWANNEKIINIAVKCRMELNFYFLSNIKTD